MNRTEVRAYLRKKGIEHVTLHYNGSGDAANYAGPIFKPKPKRKPHRHVLVQLEAYVWTIIEQYQGFELDAGGEGRIDWDLNKDHMEVNHVEYDYPDMEIKSPFTPKQIRKIREMFPKPKASTLWIEIEPMSSEDDEPLVHWGNIEAAEEDKEQVRKIVKKMGKHKDLDDDDGWQMQIRFSKKNPSIVVYRNPHIEPEYVISQRDSQEITAAFLEDHA